jgi:hypothetical protein
VSSSGDSGSGSSFPLGLHHSFFMMVWNKGNRLSLKNKNNSLSKVENLNRREWLIVNINSSMSNDTETNDRDREIDILKSTIDNLTQENKQLLESNKQLKKEYDKLRNFNISIFAPELETQIQLVLGGVFDVVGIL